MRGTARWLALCPLVSMPLAAQSASASLDLSSARMRFADSIDANSASLSPALRLSGARAAISASGTLSQLAGSWSNYGRLDASATPVAWGRFSTEVLGLAGGSSHANGTRTGQILGSARFHVDAGTRGAWIGGGVGRTWDGSWRGVVQGDAGGWMTAGANALVLSAAPTVVDDTVKYTDAFLSLLRVQEAWELGASLGFRAGQQLPTLPANRSLWGGLSAVFWATPIVGIVAAGGTYPVDFTQGYPGGQYLSLSVRLRTASGAAPPVRPAASAPAGPLRALEVQRIAGDSHRIRVRAGGARTVELAGDFTRWTPVALRPEGNGWWTAVMPIARGTHQLNVRVDGGPWLVPPGTTAMPDEFGGSVGLLVVR